MRKSLRNIGLFTLTLALAACGGTSVPATNSLGSAGANAAPNQSGAFYYAPNVARACALPQHPGEAYCLALLRTDVRDNTTPGGYGPSDLQSAYNLPSAKKGQGQTVAVVDAYDDPNAASDLAVYRKQFGLPACTKKNPCFEKVNQLGTTSSYPTANAGWAVEESLDVDMVSAICPKCKVVLVEANSSYLNDLGAAVNAAVSVVKADYVSNSYIGYGAHGPAGAHWYFHPGHMIVAAGGDEGYKIGEPAGFPSVVSVGGTFLQKSSGKRGWTESAWQGTGSGCVLFRKKPSWQKDHACRWRAMNDVSADAAPSSGVAVYDSYSEPGWIVLGGTSVASPIIASVYALAGNAKSMHFAESLYAKNASLYDVTTGNNGTCKHTVLCTAGPGWDGPTGNGTPNGISAF